MPRSKFDKYARPVPPIDWLWAAVLERKMVLGYDLQALADIAGVTYETMRHFIRQSPWEWKRDTRERLLKALGIRADVSLKLEEEQ